MFILCLKVLGQHAYIKKKSVCKVFIEEPSKEAVFENDQSVYSG